MYKMSFDTECKLLIGRSFCIQCRNKRHVQIMRSSGGFSKCIPEDECVSSDLTIKTFYPESRICSEFPAIPFCSVQTTAGCTECMPGYYLDTDTADTPSDTCKLIHTDYPFCVEVIARTCTECLFEFQLGAGDLCEPDPSSDYTPDPETVYPGDAQCSQMLPGCLECEQSANEKYVCVKC